MNGIGLQTLISREKSIDLNSMGSLSDIHHQDVENEEIQLDENFSRISLSEQQTIEEIPKEEPKKKSKVSILNSHMFKSRGPFITVLLYAILGFSDIMFQEVFPIWAWTPLNLNGLSMLPFQIGMVQGVIGFIALFNQLIFTPWLVNNFGSRAVFRIFSLCSILPLLMLIEIGRLVKIEHVLLWFTIIPIYLCQRISIFICFTASTLMVTHSVPAEELGLLNGIGQSSIALGRATGPVLGSALFAYSISGVTGFPFDYHFIFYICSTLNFTMFLISFLVPNLIN